MKKALVALLYVAITPAIHSQVIAIKAGRLVDSEAGRAATNQTILVENGKVQAIGANLAVPAGATVIDLSSATVLPGLFDAHTHLCANITFASPPRNLSELLRGLLLYTTTTTTGYRALAGAANARSMLEAGFTTVRDVGNAANYADTDLRRAIEEGLVPGPTIVNAGRIIAATGGQFPGVLNPERPNLGNPEYFYADTRDELKKAIRENILYGARIIKIVVDDQPYIYSADDIRYIVAEARQAGLKVAAHAMTEQGARNAAEGGVASIEHGLMMPNEILELAKRNNVVLVGTEFTKEYATALGIPEYHATAVDRLKRAYEVGTPIAYGTDVFSAGVPGKTFGELAKSYIESFLEAGIPASAILQMMTVNAARLLGVDKDRGAIKPGMAADIIATAENPLENIQALKRVVFVMKDGKVFKHDR